MNQSTQEEIKEFFKSQNLLNDETKKHMHIAILIEEIECENYESLNKPTPFVLIEYRINSNGYVLGHPLYPKSKLNKPRAFGFQKERGTDTKELNRLVNECHDSLKDLGYQNIHIQLEGKFSVLVN